jgi:hypothetical protein
MSYELLFGVRMLAFAQSCEVFGRNRASEIPLFGKPSLPLTVAPLVAAPIILLLRGKLPRMVGSRLTG